MEACDPKMLWTLLSGEASDDTQTVTFSAAFFKITNFQLKAQHLAIAAVIVISDEQRR
jgi:hypothetical protein